VTAPTAGLCAAILALASPVAVSAAQWTYTWPAPAGAAVPTVQVCPLLYGKSWAYSVEIDDGPVCTLTVAQPLLANYSFTDAPPGVAGGHPHPFVGSAAIFLLRIDTGNNTFLTWDQVKQLQADGWGIINHSYWHSGNHWDPTKYLKAADFHRELFWSQALLNDSQKIYPTEFVYPSGDYNYAPYLHEYGLEGGSLVGGKVKDVRAANPDFTLLDRNWLDESVWGPKNDPLAGIPAAPAPGDFIIDFTHNIDADSTSANRVRWKARLDHIAGQYGAAGDDSLWCAPTGDVVNYAIVARAAQIIADPGKITITLPDAQPGSPLTLKITGVPAGIQLPAPAGGLAYGQNGTWWITTPIIGAPGARPLPVHIKRIYDGPVGPATWAEAEKIAGVRLRQFGDPSPGYQLKVDATLPDGTSQSLLPPNSPPLKSLWGGWQLYPVIPDGPAVPATGITVPPDKCFKEMEVWAIAE